MMQLQGFPIKGTEDNRYKFDKETKKLTQETELDSEGKPAIDHLLVLLNPEAIACIEETKRGNRLGDHGIGECKVHLIGGQSYLVPFPAEQILAFMERKQREFMHNMLNEQQRQQQQLVVPAEMVVAAGSDRVPHRRTGR